MVTTGEKKNISPVPQFFRQRKGVLAASNFCIRTETEIDDINRTALEKLFSATIRQDDIYPVISIVNLHSENIRMQQSGAYSIEVGSGAVTIRIFDQRSLFYAIKTLEQLLDHSGDKVVVPFVTIKDFPDVPYRGVVEGFYGIPWSYEDRIRQLNFYGDVKMNAYIYGPKDDPYHSSPNWRDPYPDDRAAEITGLADAAKNNYVDFIWAVHPGKDIRWNDDLIHLLNKFERMYKLGVRSFAVFFDDITGEGTNAEKQAGLLNDLHDRFVRKYSDVGPLIMCPTEYNRSWANPSEGTYLDILGKRLNPAVSVLWTGSRVISDIDKKTTEWANLRLKRKIFFWWNFPVNDYVRDHILMGPVYGNSTDIGNDISGFVCNPMEKAEASMIGIFGVAAYTWNMRQYSPRKAFKDATKYILPSAAGALELFAENNSDLGPNGHGYRRTESVKIQPLVNKLKSNLIKRPDNTLIEKAWEYYHKITLAPEKIIRNTTNTNLVREIRPWLDQFALSGQAGTAVLNAFKNYDQNQRETNWNNYLEVRRLLLEMENIDKTENQNPYQPGVKTGSLVLTPFIRYAYDLLGNKIFGNPLVRRKRKVNQGHTITNIIQFQAQNIQVSDDSLSISPYQEPLVFSPGSYIGLRWPDNRIALSLHYNFNIQEIEQWGAFEVSPNGSDWVLYNTLLKEQSGDLPLKPYLRFIRFINNGDSDRSMHLNEFSIKTKMEDVRRDVSAVRDKNPRTYMIIPEGGHVKLAVKKEKAIELFMDVFRQKIDIKNHNNDNVYSGTNNYVKIDAELLNGCEEIKITNQGKNPVHLFEII